MPHVVNILKGTRGIDIDSPVGGSTAACLNQNGYLFAGRYIPLYGGSSSGDLDAGEATALTENGVAVLVVQHGRLTAYTTSNAASYGRDDAAEAISYVGSIGAPIGIYIYVDVENGNTTIDAEGLYAAAWSKYILANSPYYPEIYTGAKVLSQSILDGATWYATWTSCYFNEISNPNITQFPNYPSQPCGTKISVCGINPDPDVVNIDTGGFWGY